MKRLLLLLILLGTLSPVTYSFANASTLATNQNSSQEQYGPIQIWESLWAISIKLRPSDDVTTPQTLLSIYKLNPDVFVNGDIGRIIPNSIIKVPTLAYVEKQDHQEGVRLIKNRSAKPKQTEAQAAQSQLKTNAEKNSSSLYGPVKAKDTLWSISKTLRPAKSVSTHQTLVAIYKKNG